MIRQKVMLKSYPSKTVLEDLASRSGPPTSSSFTPFIGKADVLREQFSGSQMDRFNMEGFLAENASFEFDPTRINENKTIGILEIEEKESRNFLEDFVEDGKEAESIKKWFIQACISYKKRKESSYRKQTSTYAITSYGDDDEGQFDPRMIEVKKSEYSCSQEDYDLCIRKLPFYIKALWTYSRVYSANLFSFVAAYMDLLKNKGKTRETIIIQDFSNYTTYMLKLDGTYKRAFDHSSDVKTERYVKVIDIFRKPETNPELMSLIMNFMDVCDTLKINFEYQDTMIFNADFINKLVCTYLPTNSEYLQYYGEVDAEVSYAIRTNNLFSKTKLDIYSDPNSSIEENSEREYIADLESRLKIIYVTSTMSPNEISSRLFEGDKQLAMKNVNAVIERYNNDTYVDMSPYLDFDSGLLVRDKETKEVLKLNTDILGSYQGVDRYNILFTTTGAIIIQTIEADNLIFMPAMSVELTLEELANASRRKNYWLTI